MVSFLSFFGSCFLGVIDAICSSTLGLSVFIVLFFTVLFSAVWRFFNSGF